MLKITITRAALFAALSACAEVTPTKPVRPSLACVLLDASPVGLSLFAQGNNEALWSDAVTIAAEPGRVLVHARDLLRRIDALPEGEIEIREVVAKGGEASKIQIRQGTTRATLPLFALEDAPTIAKLESSGEVIPGRVLAALLSRLAPSMGGETQPTIHGIRLIGKDSKMLGAATNGHTLAFASCAFDGTIDTMVPAPAVAHLRRLLGKMEAEVRIDAAGSSLRVFGPGFVYSTQLASEGYPEAVLYSQIPKRGEHRAIVNREEFVAAVEYARIADQDGYLRIRPGKGTLTLRGESASGNSARSIPADSTIESCTFDAGYMLRGASQFSGESIELWVEPGNRVVDGCPEALCIREPGNDDVFVCMSIRYTAADLAPDAPEEDAA